jgi:Predicted transcriptional regulators
MGQKQKNPGSKKYLTISKKCLTQCQKFYTMVVKEAINMALRKKGKLENKIAVLRAEKKWTQQDVADKLGISRQTVISVESNKYTPSVVLAFEIAGLFGKDINEVFQYIIDDQEGGEENGKSN